VLFGFLAYLAIADSRAKAARAERLTQAVTEMEVVSETLRREGKLAEADALTLEAERLRSAPEPEPEPKPWEPGGIGGAPLLAEKQSYDSDSNRFMRRQKQAARKKKKRRSK